MTTIEDTEGTVVSAEQLSLSQVAQLVNQLESMEANAVLNTLNRITELDPQSAQIAIPRIIGLVLHHNYEIRQQALVALMHIGRDASLVVFATRKCLHDARPEVRRDAIRHLSKLGSKAVDAIFELANCALNDKDPLVQELSCLAIANMGAQAKPSLPALVELLRSGGESQRIAAANALYKTAEYAGICRPALIQSLNDSNHQVRNLAALALEKMSQNIKYG